jgi:hypothetical protein
MEACGFNGLIKSVSLSCQFLVGILSFLFVKETYRNLQAAMKWLSMDFDKLHKFWIVPLPTTALSKYVIMIHT